MLFENARYYKRYELSSVKTIGPVILADLSWQITPISMMFVYLVSSLYVFDVLLWFGVTIVYYLLFFAFCLFLFVQ
jgi:hypothetical protein